jgi:hypothetical protein
MKKEKEEKEEKKENKKVFKIEGDSTLNSIQFNSIQLKTEGISFHI